MDSTASRSALRPFELLDAFRTAGRPLSLSELSRLTSIPLSTCHSVVRALEQHGFLYFLSARRTYPTRRLWDMAREINANDPIAMRLAAPLAALRDATNETVILGVRQDQQVLYLLVIESTQTIRYSSNAGEFKPLHSSSIGKVVLASMPEPELHEWITGKSLQRVTEHTIVEPQQMLAELAASRSSGLFITRGENVADVMAIATPLRLGAMTLGVAVAGPLTRMDQQAQSISQKLLNCVRELEQRQQGEL